MRGWLVVNTFLGTEKFQTLYRMLIGAAVRHGIELELKTSGELTCVVGGIAQSFNLPDFVVFWDKDVYLARRLEAVGLRLFNTAQAVETCDNKALTAIALARAGVAAPRTIIAPKTFEGVGYTDEGFARAAVAQLGLPLVLKEVYGSFGQQVRLIHTYRELIDHVRAAGSKDLILQEYIKESAGRDVRVNVVGGKAIVSMLRENTHDFRSNITNGGSAMAWDASEDQAQVAVAACDACGLDFAGVDVLFGPDGPLVCEVNSNPHFKSTLDATGVDLSDYIIAHIINKLS